MRALISHTGLIPKVIAPHLFSHQSRFQKSPESPDDADLAHVDNPSDCTRSFILHENIHATHVVTLSVEGLGTMSKNKLGGITLGIGLDRGGTLLTSSPLDVN